MAAAAAQGSKQERTYAILRSRIIDGTYGPGNRLVIDALARELNVSPMPVREAIRRLEAEGWVVYERNQGPQVASVEAESWIDVMTTLAVLEGYATALSWPLLGTNEIAELRRINALMTRALEALDVGMMSEHNIAFHRAIYSRCPTAYLTQQIEQTLERLNTVRTSIFGYIPMRGRASVEEHERLVELIEAGESPLKIELYAREHKLRTITALKDRQALGSRSGEAD